MIAMSSRLNGYRPFLLLCFIGFAGFFCSYMRIPVLPLFAASVGAGPAQVGIVNGSFMLTTGLLSIPAGLLADRIGRRLPTVVGLAATGISSLLISQCDSAGEMAAAYLLFGAGLAAFAPSMLSQVADVTPAGKLGQAYGWYTTAIYGAMTLGPAAGGFLAKSSGLAEVFVLSGAFLLVVATISLPLLPKPHPRRMGDSHSLLAATISLLHNSQLIACLLSTLGSCIGFGIFLSFLPLHANAHGLDPAQVGIIFAAQALTNVVSRIPIGIISDRVDRRLIIASGLIFLAAGLSPVGVFGSITSLIACAIVIGIGMALTFTAIGALVAEAVPAPQRGLAMGMYNSCIYLGMMTGSILMGFFIGATDYGTGFLTSGAIAMATLALFLLLMRNVTSGKGKGGKDVSIS